MSSLGKACDPSGYAGTDGVVCVCAGEYVYVLVEVCGKCGPESTWSPTLWGAEAYWDKEKGHARAGPASLSVGR